MSEPERSVSAETVAISRAYHQIMDQDPRVLEDPLALRIVGPGAERWMHENLALFGLERMRRMRGMVTIRSRLCEDELKAAIARGTTQYVLLGAGLDTFAYRSPQYADRLTVYEVDQPGTQQWKLERLREGGIDVPANVRFVAADFNQRTLAEVLEANGFDRHQPAFFAWLGVSYYLPRESVLSTLEYIAGQDATTQVVFDFAVDIEAVPAEFRHLYAELRGYMRSAAEPWRTWFVPASLIAELRGLGFTDILHLDAAEAQRRYLDGRSDGLLPGPLVGLMSARRGASAKNSSSRERTEG